MLIGIQLISDVIAILGMTDLGPNQRVVSYNEYDVILYMDLF